MKKMNSTSQFLRLSFMMLAFLVSGLGLNAQNTNPCTGGVAPTGSTDLSGVLSAPTRVCEEKVTIALPAGCVYTLTGAELGTPARTDLMIRKLTTAGAQDFVAGYGGGAGNSTYTGTNITFGFADIGKEFEIMSGTGANMCFHYVTIVDRTAPSGTAAPSTIRCTDLSADGKIPGPQVLGSWRGASGFNTVSNPITGVTGAPVFNATDCSSFTQSYEDIYCPINPCSPNGGVYQTVTRRWKLADIYGNFRFVDQTITVRAPRLSWPGAGTGSQANPFVTVITDCNASVNNAGLPTLIWGGGILNQVLTEADLGKTFCTISIQRTNDVPMDLCKGSYMRMREYKVGICNVFSTVYQTVNVLDKTTPAVRLSYNDFLRQEERQCFDMNGMQMTEFVYKTVRTPINRAFGDSRDGAVANTATPTVTNAAIKITPLVSSINCNQASIDIDMTVTDPNCSASKGGKLTLSGSVSNDPAAVVRFAMAGMSPATTMSVDNGTVVKVTGTFSNIPGNPDPVVTLVVTDECGNRTEVKLTVVIYDNVSPTSICEAKQVSLTNNGQAVVFPSTFSDQTYDNCSTPTGLPIEPATAPIRQLIRLTTAANNGCWSERLLLDCNTASGKVDIRTIDGCGNYSDCCVDFQLINKNLPTCVSYMDVTTECTNPALSNLESFFTTPATYAVCGPVTVVSPPAVLNLTCGGGTATKSWTFTNNGQSVTCTQRLTVTPVSGFRVRPLPNVDLPCGSYVYDEATERAAALAEVRLLNANGAVTCSAPVVEVEKWEYSNTQFCKIIRLRYTFVDKCLPYCGIINDANHTSAYVNFGATVSNAGYAAPVGGFYQARDFSFCSNAGGLLFGYERVIRINDNTRPTSVVPTIADICFPDNRCNFDFPAITLTGRDLCDNGSVTGSNLTISWTVTNPAGTQIAAGNGTTSATTTGIAVAGTALRNLAGGTYTIRYSVADFCGNINWYSFTITGKDCKTPFVLVHEKNLSLGYDLATRTGMGTVIVADVLNNLGDNCTGYDFLLSKTGLQRATDAAVYSDALPKSLMFTCADKGKVVAVRVWTRDEAGNSNFVLTYITVTDPQNACSVVPLSTIAGTLKTENNIAVKGVVVSGSINGTVAGSGTTDAAGSFSLQATLDQNVQVKAVKIATEDKYAGVTTFDIARISKHLLDIEKFASPYSVIAADVNKDGEVDATDMLQIRNFILRKTTTLPGGVWRFIDASYKFTNPANPFGEDFPEVVNLSKVAATAAANFTAVKLGDVNTTYVSALTGVQVRNSKALTLQAEDMQLVAGNEYTVNITADNFNAIAFQGTISMNGATVKSVKAGDLANYNDGNFGVFANEITTSWNGASKLNANVMSITFVANKSAKLSEVLTVGNSLTPAVANDIAGNEMNVNLKFTTGKVVGGEFALYQNTPNPVALETTIGFNLPKDESARLTVYSVDGKTILAKQVAGKAGLNQITINKSELNANGVMYYRLETAEHTATKKMVIIE